MPTVCGMAADIPNGHMYLVGKFHAAGSSEPQFVVRWDGASWTPMGNPDMIGTGALVHNGLVYMTGMTTPGHSSTAVTKWNPAAQTWEALGGADFDVGATVWSICAAGDYIYIGGDFTSIYVGGNTLSAAGVARYRISNNTWTTIGSIAGDTDSTDSQPGSVRVLTLNGDPAAGGKLYAGGNFVSVGGVTSAGLAAWDSVAGWSALGSGVSGGTATPEAPRASVLGLGISGTKLFVGGNFSTISGVSAANVGVGTLSGTTWTFAPAGAGVNGPAHSIVPLTGSSFYIGGEFTTATDTTVKTVNGVARWNGTSWSKLGTGTGSGVQIGDQSVDQSGNFAFVAAMAKFGGDSVVVGGRFAAANFTSPSNPGIGAGGAAIWNSQFVQWRNLTTGEQNGLDGPVFAYATDNSGNLYAGGSFLNGQVTPNIPGAEPTVFGTRLNGIGKWNGAQWSPLGSGVSNSTGDAVVSAVAVDGNTVYVGGSFETAGGVSAKNVAKAVWNGTTWTWSPLGSGTLNGVNAPVNSLLLVGTGSTAVLYVGGSFTVATDGTSPKTVNGVARFSNGTWSALTQSSISGVASTGDPVVFALALNPTTGEILLGGHFETAGPVSSVNLARWNPVTSTFGSVVTGLDGDVLTLLGSSTGETYAGGLFVTANGVPVNKIMRLSSTYAVTKLANGVDDNVESGQNVNCIARRGRYVYVGGFFSSVDPVDRFTRVTAQNVARFDTVTGVWSALGSGVTAAWWLDPSVYALSTPNDDATVYVGGGFSYAGFGIRQNYMAAYFEPPLKYEAYSLSSYANAEVKKINQLGESTGTSAGYMVRYSKPLNSQTISIAHGPYGPSAPAIGHGINESRVVVGRSYDYSVSLDRGTLWASTSSYYNMYPVVFPRAINNTGRSVGNCGYTAEGQFAYDLRDNGLYKLVSPIGGSTPFITFQDVTDGNLIIGYSTALSGSSSVYRAIKHRDGVTCWIGSFTSHAYGLAVSSMGHLGGYVMSGSNPLPWIVADGLQTTMLPLPAGQTSGQTLAVNAQGHAAGYTKAGTTLQPVIWRQDGAGVYTAIQLSLTTSGPGLINVVNTGAFGSLTRINSMNDRGQLVGAGKIGTSIRPFLLCPRYN